VLKDVANTYADRTVAVDGLSLPWRQARRTASSALTGRQVGIERRDAGAAA
jgi:hypothetical protein